MTDPESVSEDRNITHILTSNNRDNDIHRSYLVVYGSDCRSGFSSASTLSVC